MIRNYFIIAWRNLLRNPGYSAINVMGLSIGVACCLLLSLYIQDELSYDKHHDNINDLYRINSHWDGDNVSFKDLAYTSPPIAMTMKEEIPDVVDAVRILNPPTVERILIKYENNLFYETKGHLADSTLFNVFKYDLIEGNPAKALTLANTLVISEGMAKRLFNNESAMDKLVSLSLGGQLKQYKVTGVFKENYKSIIDANFFMSMMSEGWGDYVRGEGAKYWAGNNFIPAYLKLAPGHDKIAVEKKMNEILMKHGAEDLKAMGMKKTLSLEPVKDIYLKSTINQSPRITSLYIIASIGAFILLIACINFMNLSTAKAAKRATEIGIRKTVGAYRSSLMTQIFGEAMVIVFCSLIIGIVLVQIGLPFFNSLTDKNIAFNSQNIIYFAIAGVLITVITGLLADSYPALYLSSFQPAHVLKGKLNLGTAAGRLREGLVIFQFMIAIALVCGIFIIAQQLKFMQEKNLGFDETSKIILPLRTDAAHHQYDGLKKEIEGISSVQEVSGANYLPSGRIFSDMLFYTEGGNMDNALDIERNTVDMGYIELLKISLVAGRSFSENRQSDSNRKVILNKTAVSRFNSTPEKMVGQKIHFDWRGEHYSYDVIGVIDDYNQNSLHEKIKPTLFQLADSTKHLDNMVVSVALGKFKETIQNIEKIWKAQVVDTPFEFNFLDDNIKKQYKEDQRASSIITTFAFIAMLICSLGLYGLSSYMAERRVKEIGIRKVMGASVSQLTTMMTSEFLKLVLIAFAIASPLAWWVMNKWLSSFEYRININLIVFVFAGLVALAIALITVSFESIKSARGNPIKSLRSE